MEVAGANPDWVPRLEDSVPPRGTVDRLGGVAQLTSEVIRQGIF
jgi:hypothetical protein